MDRVDLIDNCKYCLESVDTTWFKSQSIKAKGLAILENCKATGWENIDTHARGKIIIEIIT